jgi:hypothetical protein
MPKSMSSDLIQGWTQTRISPGASFSDEHHPQLVGINHVHAF